MKRLFLNLLAGLVIVVLYDLIDLRLFSIDILRQTRLSYFNLFAVPEMQEDVLILSTGSLTPEEIPAQIDTLLKFKPALVGLNICDIPGNWRPVSERYRGSNTVIVANCERTGPLRPAALVSDGNTVTHCIGTAGTFESIVANSSGRGNDLEMINYQGNEVYYGGDLVTWTKEQPFDLYGLTVLIGFCGEPAVLDDPHPQYMRVTPLNKNYASAFRRPDMYNILISANIVSMLRDGNYIHETSSVARAIVLFLVLAISVVFLTYVQPRKIIWHMLLATLYFLFVMIAVSATMVWLFSSYRVYVDLDELPIALLAITLFTIGQRLFSHSRPRAKTSLDEPANRA